MQPIDVAFFRPMKQVWRKNIKEHRETHNHQTSLPKSQFPSLLKKLHDQLSGSREKAEKSIMSGFRKSGLYPVNPSEPLSQVPQLSNPTDERQVTSPQTAAAVSSTVTHFLNNMRNPVRDEHQPKGER